MISGAPSSIRRARRLFLLIILLYKSLRSDVANLPPSSCTIGLKSGGITGISVRIIHSGLVPAVRNASITSILLTSLAAFCEVVVASSALSFSSSASRSTLLKSSRIASAPIPTLNSSPYWSYNSLYSCSDNIFLNGISVSPGSITIYEAKYNTFSRFLGPMSRIKSIRLGIPLKYQICDTGAAK